MTVWQTVLIFVVVPAAIIGVIALLTELPSITRGPRYRPGQPWTYEPVWWAGHPGGTLGASAANAAAHDAGRRTPETATTESPAATPVRTARGGARGNW